MHLVQISFNVNDLWRQVQYMLERTAGRKADASGTGFGVRDVGWFVDEPHAARVLADRLREQFPTLHLVVTLMEEQ